MEAADAAMKPARRPAGLEPRSVRVAVAAVGRMNDGDADCLLIFEGDEARWGVPPSAISKSAWILARRSGSGGPTKFSRGAFVLSYTCTYFRFVRAARGMDIIQE